MRKQKAAERYRTIYKKLYGRTLKITVNKSGIQVDFVNSEAFTAQQLNAMSAELEKRARKP